MLCTVPVSYTHLDVYKRQLLDYLRMGGEVETHNVKTEGLFVRVDKKWIEIFIDECKIEKQGFVRQSCFIGMGKYVYFI